MKSKCNASQEVGKKIRLLEGEKIYVGLDVHKRSYHMGVWSKTRERVLTAQVRNADSRSLSRYLAPYRENIEGIVYEAGPTGFSLVRHLREKGFPVDVVSAAHIPVMRKQEAKSDSLDCRKLAEYACKGLLHPINIPTAEEEADRQLVRTREQLRKKQQQIKTQIRSFLLTHGISEPKGLGNWSIRAIAALRSIKCPFPSLQTSLEFYLDELDHARMQMKKITAKVRSLKKEVQHREDATRLETIPGVGTLTSVSVLVELPNPSRFKNGREVGAIIGLAPLVRSSGETRKEMGRQRGGNRRLRTVLVETAWRWIRLDPGANKRYRKLLMKTGNPKKAIVAMARRLGIIMWRMLTRKEDYRPLRA